MTLSMRSSLMNAKMAFPRGAVEIVKSHAVGEAAAAGTKPVTTGRWQLPWDDAVLVRKGAVRAVFTDQR
jgi:hypothetical protein